MIRQLYCKASQATKTNVYVLLYKAPWFAVICVFDAQSLHFNPPCWSLLLSRPVNYVPLSIRFLAQTTQILVISRCRFAQDGKEMYTVFKRTSYYSAH